MRCDMDSVRAVLTPRWKTAPDLFMMSKWSEQESKQSVFDRRWSDSSKNIDRDLRKPGSTDVSVPTVNALYSHMKRKPPDLEGSQKGPELIDHCNSPAPRSRVLETKLRFRATRHISEALSKSTPNLFRARIREEKFVGGVDKNSLGRCRSVQISKAEKRTQNSGIQRTPSFSKRALQALRNGFGLRKKLTKSSRKQTSTDRSKSQPSNFRSQGSAQKCTGCGPDDDPRTCQAVCALQMPVKATRLLGLKEGHSKCAASEVTPPRRVDRPSVSNISVPAYLPSSWETQLSGLVPLLQSTAGFTLAPDYGETSPFCSPYMMDSRLGSLESLPSIHGRDPFKLSRTKLTRELFQSPVSNESARSGRRSASISSKKYRRRPLRQPIARELTRPQNNMIGGAGGCAVTHEELYNPCAQLFCSSSPSIRTGQTKVENEGRPSWCPPPVLLPPKYPKKSCDYTTIAGNGQMKMLNSGESIETASPPVLASSDSPRWVVGCDEVIRENRSEVTELTIDAESLVPSVSCVQLGDPASSPAAPPAPGTEDVLAAYHEPRSSSEAQSHVAKAGMCRREPHSALATYLSPSFSRHRADASARVSLSHSWIPSNPAFRERVTGVEFSAARSFCCAFDRQFAFRKFLQCVIGVRALFVWVTCCRLSRTVNFARIRSVQYLFLPAKA